MQLAGGVTAVQLKPIALAEDAVAVSPVGAEGTAPQLADVPRISMPLTTGWLAAPCGEGDHDLAAAVGGGREMSRPAPR